MDGAWLDASQRFAADEVTAMGGRVVSIVVREAHARPDGEWLAGFDATVEWAGHAPCAELIVVATDGASGAIRAWRYPSDPLLPGLAAAVEPTEVAAFLGEPALSLQVVALRPCRRAVVRARGEGVDVHLKVVAPRSARVLADRHLALRTAGVPVPHVRAVDVDRGWVVFDTVPGRTLDECLDSPDGPLLEAQAVWSLVESIVGVRLEPMFEVPTSTASALHHAQVISAVLPPLADRVHRLLDGLLLGSDPPSRGTVHGDLHAGQLLVDGRGLLVGVLDVDGAGVGDPLDDIARLIAHAMVSASASPREGVRRWRFAARMVDAAESRAAVGQLSTRVAASVLAHATGPWRAQADNWPTEVERLVSLAEEVLTSGAVAAIGRRLSG